MPTTRSSARGPATRRRVVRFFIGVTAVMLASAPIASAQIIRPPLVRQPLPQTPDRTPVIPVPTVFGQHFSWNALGYDARSVYLLCYLSTAVYADRLPCLDPAYRGRMGTASFTGRERVLQRNAALFEAEYRKYLGGLFPVGTAFHFESTPANTDGWDAEAMLIESPIGTIVVFRGTDRVGYETSSLSYTWREWIDTDFRADLIAQPGGVAGRVHRGFLDSVRFHVQGALDARIDAIRAAYPERPLWITGHSLGGAQAIVYTAHLRARGVPVQGTYTFAAPRVGDGDFRAWINGRMNNGIRIQRFDFGEDLITMAPLAPMGYTSPGRRNWYRDLRNITRGADEWGNRLGGDVCHHYPPWYLLAAWNQLPAELRASLPPPEPFGYPEESADPDGYWFPCSYTSLRRADSESWIADDVRKAGDAAREAAETLLFTAKTLIDNATGTAVSEGVYYIRPLLRADGYLQLPADRNGTELRIWALGSHTKDNKFRVVREVPYNRIETLYRHDGNNGTLILDAEAQSLHSSVTKAQVWERNYVPGTNDNQKWLLARIGGPNSNRYLIYSTAAAKVLTVTGDVAANGCRVELRKAEDNNRRQVWVLERVSG